MALQPSIPRRQRPNVTMAPMSSNLGTGMFRNQGSGRRGGGGGPSIGGPTLDPAGGGAGGVYPSPGGGGMYSPGQAGQALMTGPTTYSAQNDPLLMENVKNLRGRMGADVQTAQKQRAGADIETAAASERKKLATMAARSGGAGALNEMSGDLADKALRAKAGAMTDIGIEGEKRKDALTLGGQGIYAAPGQQNLAERGFLANVDSQKAAQALQGAQFNLGAQNQQFNQALQTAQYLNPTPVPPGGGGSPYGGGLVSGTPGYAPRRVGLGVRR